MLNKRKEKYGWEFLFLGANMDAIAAAKDFGIEEDKAVEYRSDDIGTRLNYAVMSEAICEFRTKGTVEKSWKQKIENDRKNRK